MALACVAWPAAASVTLVDLYNAAGGATWSNNANWNTTADVCTWIGVTCSADGTRVAHL